ncbi:MAG: VWA domain-containing protein [Myxococcota bacterium]|nr:VWA domain-containing protein [Myxococcota bacterium]
MILLVLLGCLASESETASPPVDTDTALQPAVLSLDPDALDFGDLPRGCTASRQVTTANTGGADLSVLSAAVTGSGASAFAVTPPSEAIAGGAAATLEVTFTPTALYDYDLPLTVETDVGSATLQVSGSGVAGASVTDEATITLNAQVDVLLLVDSTESMTEPLVAVGDALPTFWARLTGEDASVHLGVLTMDMEEPDQSGRLLDIHTEDDAVPALPAAISTDTEQGLAALSAALSEPLRSMDNAGFRRDGVPLTVIVFSDEDDDSDLALSEIADLLTAEAGVLHAMVEARKPDQVCQTEPGVRYLELQEETGGQFVSLCADDLAPLLSELAQDILGLSATFSLSQPPDSTDSLSVTKNGEPVPPGLTDGWTLDTTDSTITLHGIAAPAVGDVFSFSYTTTTCP